jgi:hypothetical protein
MVSILNVNPDIYINCKYDDFRIKFIEKHKLRPGDIIGVIKDTLNNCFIIGKNNTIEDCKMNNKLYINAEISNLIRNPVLYYKSISYLIDRIEFNATHFCFRKLLDYNSYKNIKISYRYSNSRYLIFSNNENAIYKHKMESLVLKDNVLIFILDSLSKNYTTIKRKYNLTIFNVDKIINKLKNELLIYWYLSSYKQKISNNNSHLELEVKLPVEDIDLFNKKFKFT